MVRDSKERRAVGLHGGPEGFQWDGGGDSAHIVPIEPEERGVVVEKIGVVIAAESLGMRTFEGEEGDEAAGLVEPPCHLLEASPAGGI